MAFMNFHDGVSWPLKEKKIGDFEYEFVSSQGSHDFKCHFVKLRS